MSDQVKGNAEASVGAERMWPELAESERDFPEMWVRCVVISAALVVAGFDWGPTVLPSTGWVGSSRRGASTLYPLPGGRAVLSGGVWESPNLNATYNDGADMPNFYAGAPDCVANPVLNPRASNGLAESEAMVFVDTEQSGRSVSQSGVTDSSW
ncbi:hypothetical protein AB0B25_24875 [Nocardia sp. NPDC049190]|uniref:hypothetical protein n=1 Tax=Nocardia sp. NPDC049190 TaxID=3155650 RepID=UPI0033E2AB1C